VIVMTLLEHNLAPRAAAAETVRVQVNWISTRREANGPFVQTCAVLAVQSLDAQRAIIEMWVEERGRRLAVQDRTLTKSHSIIEHGLLHIDAGDICRLTLKLPQVESDSRLLYAQCAWLERAGFTAGTFDRPTAELGPAPAIAVSA
jgi:hypothetical protein